MKINTHRRINEKFCGKALVLKENHSEVLLQTTREMVSDDFGLIHGGFIFGAADYTAMLAVNHPNVVLGSSSIKFLKPVSVNQEINFKAKVIDIKNKKYTVSVIAYCENLKVFEGMFICFVPEKHVLGN